MAKRKKPIEQTTAVTVEEPKARELATEPKKLYPGEVVDVDSKGRRFAPRPCTMCETRRDVGVNKSYVYCVKRQDGCKIRHCKCGNCYYTWKEVETFY